LDARRPPQRYRSLANTCHRRISPRNPHHVIIMSSICHLYVIIMSVGSFAARCPPQRDRSLPNTCRRRISPFILICIPYFM
jgi:hypothetical protein